MVTEAVHVKHDVFDVYIGRRVNMGPTFFPGSKWANPYRITATRSREQAIEAYREYLQKRPDLLAALPELKGKRLGCWCAPLTCHGDVLAELVEAL